MMELMQFKRTIHYAGFDNCEMHKPESYSIYLIVIVELQNWLPAISIVLGVRHTPNIRRHYDIMEKLV